MKATIETTEPRSMVDGASAKESRNSRTSKTAIRPKVQAVITDKGAIALGYNVQKFLQRYM
mgnify:CR=1 FL=1